MKNDQQHIVAVFGAGVAGSEAAIQFARQGIPVVVFEKNALPYGKIEEGLPKWHIKLRDQEEAKIDSKLNHDLIYFVPKVTLGKDLSVAEVLEWGFSAVLLAIGAWRDRPLPIADIDRFVGKGLYYQNPFVEWFNHNHEKDYKGPHCHVEDNAIVIGGGLASLDVVKILMLETVLTALQKKGIDVDLFTLERLGIAQVLQDRGLNLKEIGVKGCTMFYRRGLQEMPLSPLPEGASPERIEKVFQIRERIFRNYQEKYLFQFLPHAVPVDKIVEGGRLAGLVFGRTKYVRGKLQLQEGSEFQVKTPLVISSIGSIPEPVAGIDPEGELLPVEDPLSGRIKSFDNLYAVGNAVTGRGNIRESLIHGRQISHRVMEDLLEEDATVEYQALIESQEEESSAQVKNIQKQMQTRPSPGEDTIRNILQRVREFWGKVGYDGNYEKWIRGHMPIRLEQILGYTETDE
ncbi:MAG: hypothetical protein Kow0042_01240 [Calditrichia bacterium]